MAFEALTPIGRVLPCTPAGSFDLNEGGGGLAAAWNPGSWRALIAYEVSPLDNRLSVLGGPFSRLRQRDRRKAAQTYIAPPPVHDNALHEAKRNHTRRSNGSACGIRTRDLRLERAASWAARPMRHDWLGILDSNQGLQIQSLLSYH